MSSATLFFTVAALVGTSPATNAVHGHAAKLWTNPYSTLVISDDHSALTRVTLSRPSRVIGHDDAKRQFADAAAQVASQKGRKDVPIADPEYWFLLEVKEIVQQREPLSANRLDSSRPTDSLNAGGRARHDKKPGYFAADTLPPYDRDLQHARETAGRPVDPTGEGHRRWRASLRDALRERQARLLGSIDAAPEQILETALSSELMNIRRARS